MKIKSLILMCACLGCLAGCSQSPDPTTAPSSVDPATSTQPSGPKYLTFVAEGKLRVDVFGVSNVNFSYGNSALPNGVNDNIALDDSFSFSVNQNDGEDTSYNFIIIGENSARLATSVNLGIEGNELTNYLEIDKSDLRGMTRGYVAISFGNEPLWTKGLNASLDAAINALIPKRS